MRKELVAQNHNIVNYFVDESGDFTLFDKKGAPVQGDGVSKTFMLGLLKIKDNSIIESNFKTIKDTIISDPIFQSFPSFQKTKIHFHAKDDHIAIRREIYKWLTNLDFSVQVVIRRKSFLVDQAKTQFQYTKNKIIDKQLYGDLVERLFKRNIHKTDCNIYFSKRSKTFTNSSLKESLEVTKQRFCDSYNIISNSNLNVFCSLPSEYAGLQIIDYCLWSLQRMYEQSEDVYFNMIEDKFKLIIDVDDKRYNKYGTHYCKKNKISLTKIDGVS